MSYWAIAHIESQRERTAAEFLNQGGFTTYLPRLRVKQRAVPLFPGYLFVQIVERWYPVRWSVGVLRVLMAGEQPYRLPDGVIVNIRRREDREGFVKIPKYGLQLGQSVRIVKGSFAGQIAVFDGMAGHERSRILLELLGRKTTVELPTQDIVALVPPT
jgi:transcriptional antiterminator RfaH